MTAKTFDELFPAIQDDEALEFTRAELNGVRVALRWLDQHSDRVPGRTMTRADYNEWLEHVESRNVTNRGVVNMTLRRLGVSVPDPTNAEKLEAALRRCNYAGGPEYIAQQLDEAGVTAP